MENELFFLGGVTEFESSRKVIGVFLATKSQNSQNQPTKKPKKKNSLHLLRNKQNIISFGFSLLFNSPLSRPNQTLNKPHHTALPPLSHALLFIFPQPTSSLSSLIVLFSKNTKPAPSPLLSKKNQLLNHSKTKQKHYHTSHRLQITKQSQSFYLYVHMAVEARHLNLFSPQLLGNREMMNPIEANTNIYNTQMGYGLPLSGTTTATDTLPPMYNSSIMVDSIPQKTPIKSESGLTYNIPAPRKRPRETINPLFAYANPPQSNNKASCNTTPFSFLGHDVSVQIQQQQLDIDRLISQHMEKVKMEIEEKRKRQARRIIEAIEEGMVKRLRAKEEEIEKIGKLNWALEERVKSLCIENQIWRDLAQNNEATANALRTNLKQVLAAQVKDERTRLDETNAAAATALMDDAESCCGSTGDETERRTLANKAQDKATSSASRLCRNCGEEEACVLLLPCRHLCLCGACGSSLPSCPICKATKNGSLHVNMS